MKKIEKKRHIYMQGNGHLHYKYLDVPFPASATCGMAGFFASNSSIQPTLSPT